MKYDITYACGHTGTVNLYGPNKERERKISWLESRCLCKECEEAENAKRRAEEKAQLGLPELEGSEKQVKWADDLRHEFYTAAMDLKTKMEMALLQQHHPRHDEAIQITHDYARDVGIVMHEAKDARFWIDNRHVVDYPKIIIAHYKAGVQA